MIRICFLVLILAGASHFPADAADAAPPPVEAFGRLEAVRSVKMSPDGTHFAAIRTLNGAKSLMTYNLYGPPGKKVKAMSFEGKKNLDEELSRIFWANDSRLVVVVEVPSRRWGTEVMETRMIAMESDLTEQQVIPKVKNPIKPKAGKRSIIPTQLQDRVLHLLPDDPDHILIELDKEGRGRDLDVYRLDVYTGGLAQVAAAGISRIGGFGVDVSGEVRIRYRYRPDQDDFATDYREDANSGWHQILDDEVDGLGMWSLEAFSGDRNKIYVSGNGAGGRNEIHELDLPSSTITRKVFAHERFDAGGIARSEDGSRVTGIRYQDHRSKIAFFDPVWREMQQRIDALIPGQFNRLMSKDKAGAKWIVLSGGVSEPGTWYLFVKSESSLAKIGQRYPRLEGHQMRPVEPYEFTARDGLSIPGYLTRPGGEGPYPTVIFPHGGPNSRDTMEFDYQAQFFASRGYAVLQPNFRGSTGYGSTFEEAGHHQWGLAMQDDLTDGTLALIEQGIADPKRICIVGNSYGGYAALMGAVKTPDLYQCAASFGGVTDVKKLLAYWSEFKFNNDNDPRIGDRWEDGSRLRDTSPANNIDAIKIPILLMHGENDRRVLADQSKLMARRLKGARKPHKLIIFKGGDHHLSFEKNRIRYLKELEVFLAKHIGG